MEVIAIIAVLFCIGVVFLRPRYERKRISTLKAKVKEQERCLIDLRTSISELSHENHELNEHYQKHLSERRQVDEKLVQAKRIIVSLKKRKDDLIFEIDELELKLFELEETTNELKIRLHAKRKIVESLKEKLENAENRIKISVS